MASYETASRYSRMSLIEIAFGKRCRMCSRLGASLVGPVAPTNPGNFRVKEFSLLHCRQCDVVYLDPLPEPADLKLMYEDAVQFSNDPHYTAADQVEKILDYYGTAVRNLRLLPASGERVLEIGAGLAWVSRACKSADQSVVTVAQDVSSECAEICPWVDRYFVGSLELLPERGPYALISLTHVIEHLIDPVGALRTMAALLAPGGRAFITAPFRPTGWQRGQGIAAWRTYSYLHVPAHITYFSRRWFELHTARDFRIAHWDASSEDGQSFELVLIRN